MNTYNWQDLRVCTPLLRAIADLGFEHPTPVQALAAKPIIDGRDVCATACTGSGKTIGFLLPVIHRLLLAGRSGDALARVVIVSPSRELSAQTFRVFEQLTKYTQLSGILIVGGNGARSVQAEAQALVRSRPDVVIATPGRLCDHLMSSQGFSLDATEVLIIDEADKLLSLGFQDQVNEILARCPNRQQTLLFSATLGADVRALSRVSLRSPVEVTADAAGSVAATLRQEFVRLQGSAEDGDRLATLFALITRDGLGENTIVFFGTKALLARAAAAARVFDLQVAELHGDLTQPQRTAMLARFSRGEDKILFCTNIAARGIDLPDVRHVISLGLPRDLDDYIHRVGRTARAGKSGCAITIVDDKERRDLKSVVQKSGGKPFARTVDATARNLWRERIAANGAAIAAELAAVKRAQEVAAAERDLAKVENIAKHGTEIMAAPKRVWDLGTGEAATNAKSSAEAREAARRRRAELTNAQTNSVAKRTHDMLAHARVVKRLERDYQQGLITRTQLNAGRVEGGLQDRDAVKIKRKSEKRLAKTIARQRKIAMTEEKTEMDHIRDMAAKMKAAKTDRVKKAHKGFHSKKKFKRR